MERGGNNNTHEQMLERSISNKGQGTQTQTQMHTYMYT
jgi:hypothetical protein